MSSTSTPMRLLPPGSTPSISAQSTPRRQGQLIEAARTKFEDVLSGLIRGEEDFEYDEDGNVNGSGKKGRKRGGRKETKVKKEKNTDTNEPSASTSKPQSCFALKLFDRTVDLTQFSSASSGDDVPLYPVCRAWIRNSKEPVAFPWEAQRERNRTNEITIKREILDSDESDSDMECIPDIQPTGISRLPEPRKRPKDSEGKEIDLRIPKSVREWKRPTPNLDALLLKPERGDEDIDESQVRANMLSEHMERWKVNRQEWKKSLPTE